MAYFNVEAEVVGLVSQAISDSSGASSNGVPVPTSLKPQDAARSLETLHALFNTADAPNNDYDERPHKRRKIDAKTNNDNQPAHFPEDRSVVLAKISINLVGPHIECCTTRSQTDESLEARCGSGLTASAVIIEDWKVCHSLPGKLL